MIDRTPLRNRIVGIDAALATKANEAGNASYLLAKQALEDVIRAANLGRGSGQMLRVCVGDETYQIAIVRPLTEAQAIHERKSVTGFLTLGRASDDYPAAGGTTRMSITCDDPTPEGKIARDGRDNKKLGAERGSLIRLAQREHGYDQPTAAIFVDYQANKMGRWTAGVNADIPAGWTPPASKVDTKFKAFTGEQTTAAAGWTQAHDSWVDSLKGQVRAGSLTPVDATKLLKLWREKHPQPQHTNA